MPSVKKNAISKFPLRLMPSIRKNAERLSEREGVSLNQFINVAVTEKVAHLEHEEWLARRTAVRNEDIAKAIGILSRPTGNPPEPGDEISKTMRVPNRKGRGTQRA